MKNEDNHHKIGYVSRCGGIPVHPAEYDFQMDDSIQFTEEEEEARRKKLSKFLAKYGLKLHETR